LGCHLQVDGRRWRHHGVLGTAWRNARLRQAWRRGINPQQLAHRYYGSDGAQPLISPECT
jgi:hypothetical protein